MDAQLNIKMSDIRDEMWWMDHANCRNMDVNLFFLHEQTGNNYSSFAREVCASCDVSKQCADYADKNMFDHGLFGGLSPNERKKRRAKIRAVQSSSDGGDSGAVHGAVLFGRGDCEGGSQDAA